jgi:hypothetical protein
MKFATQFQIFALCLGLCSGASALTVPNDAVAAQREYAVVVDVEVGPSNQGLRLRFLDSADNLGYQIHRRAWGSLSWGAPIANLPAGSTSFLDSSVVAGQLYEYQVRKPRSNTITATGYVTAGLDVDRSEYRGRVILLIDSSLTIPLAAEIQRLTDDLTGDGWWVFPLNVARGSGWTDGGAAPGIRGQIQNLYNLAPANDKPKQLIILGHVPVPRAGLDAFPPDDHEENRGAYGADSYYAELDGTWTDTGTSPANLRPFHANVPGDGLWDQDFLPSSLELGFGRIDFFDLNNALSAQSELQLLRRYLDKNHAFRHRSNGFVVPARGAFVEDGYVDTAEMAWRTLPGIFGAAQSTNVRFATIDAAGGPEAWVGSTGPYALFLQTARVPDIGLLQQNGAKAVIAASDQSYFGLWAEPNQAIRATIGVTGLSLAFLWNVGPKYVLSDLSMGLPLGDATRRSTEHSRDVLLFERPERIYDDFRVYRRTNMQLIGDPTLRLFQIAPPTGGNLTSGVNQAALSWTASSDPRVVGYHVYRHIARVGRYTRLTTQPLAGTQFVDSSPPAGAIYQVRAIVAEVTGGGRFFNASQALFIENSAVIFRNGFE